MPFALKTTIYSEFSLDKKIAGDLVEFETFRDALTAAEHVAKVLSNVIKLTRHSSCETSINHAGFYADHYNELAITVYDTEKYNKQTGS